MLNEVNKLTRGCNITIKRFRELIPIIRKRFELTDEEAFKQMQKTRNMEIPEESLNTCANCGGTTINKVDGQRKYRWCNICEKAEYLDLINRKE